ncbi:hypothetical protein Q9233_013769 [Columba guinea]|nr:hypothetical protein Q9233_013769 [Columba guinea]
MGILSITDQPPLVQAIFNRDIEEVRSLLNQKENINVLDQERRTPLHAAAYIGDVAILELLILSGANVNAKDTVWLTPLHRAAASRNEVGHLEVLKLLVARGADVMCKDKKGYTLLHTAAASGQIEVVRHLLRLGVEIDEPNSFGNTALHIACYMGQDAVANELVNYGANVNQPNEKGFTPLHFAAVSTNGALCLELLVNNGADVNFQSKEGKSPLHMAAIHGRFTRSQILIQNGSEIDCADKYGNTPLHVAARYGHELLISTLMTNGADTARRGIHDMFPLHLAVLFGFSDCCRKLLSSGQLYSIVSSLSNEHVLSAGFDINTPDNLGRTCLHAAASGGNVECLNLLLSSGADLRRRDKFGRTPLHYAAANGSYQCTVTLVTAGASINEADCKGCTPLHYAAASDTYRRAETHSGNSHDSDEEPLKESRLKEAFFCLEFLLDNGADPSLRDKQGYTAVHYAAAYGNRQNLELLLEMSFNCLEDVESTVPVSPLHLAAYNGHCEALKTLAETLVNLDVRDHKGRTALYLATERGSTECVEAVTGCEDCLAALLDHDAFVLWHEDCLELLLEHNPFAYLEGNPFTPLHCAVINNQDGTAEMLVEALGAKIVNSRDAKGRTPLHAAAFADNVHGLQLLLRHQAEVDTTDKLGRTPLMMASENGHSAALEFLLYQAKANITVLDVNKNTALHLACSKGHEKCALLILGETHDLGLINASNSALQMPLHIAARNGLASVDVADCLALILSTMKPFPPKDAIGSFSFNLLKNCGIAAKACGPLPNGSAYGQERPSAIGLDGCYSE